MHSFRTGHLRGAVTEEQSLTAFTPARREQGEITALNFLSSCSLIYCYWLQLAKLNLKTRWQRSKAQSRLENHLIHNRCSAKVTSDPFPCHYLWFIQCKGSDGVRVQIYRKISEQKPQWWSDSIAEHQEELFNILLAWKQKPDTHSICVSIQQMCFSPKANKYKDRRNIDDI